MTNGRARRIRDVYSATQLCPRRDRAAVLRISCTAACGRDKYAFNFNALSVHSHRVTEPLRELIATCVGDAPMANAAGCKTLL
jgi:hypothetical protein